MASTSNQPSFFKVLSSDTLSKFLSGLPVVFWCIGIATGVMGLSVIRRGRELGPETGQFFILLATIVTIAVIPLVFLRVRSIQAVFRRAKLIDGVVTKVSYFDKASAIEFSYKYRGSDYTGYAGVKKQSPRIYDEGDNIQLVVDPEKPKRYFVADFYGN